MKKIFSSVFVISLLFLFLNLSWAEEVSKISLSLPALQWTLEVDLPGFELSQNEIAPSGSAARFQAENPKLGVVVSAFLEKSPRNGNSKDCRSHYWGIAQNSPFIKEGIQLYELEDLALVEYMVPEFQGIKVNQKNINAYLAIEGYWVDIHISKINYQDDDDGYIKSLIKNISINRKYIPSAYDNFHYGDIFFRQDQYKKAIPYFEKALAQESKKQTLGNDFFKITVDLLGMSYGISGDLKKSKEIYQRAIKQEPKYPLFYYNLACVHAESNEIDFAISNLQKAFLYKQNMLPGETLPDPSTDSSFSKLMNNESFRIKLNKLKNSPTI